MAAPTASSLEDQFPFNSQLEGVSLIDVHAHLIDAGFPDDSFASVVTTAQKHRVVGAVCVPMCVEEFELCRKRCLAYPEFLYPAAGIHPVSYSLLPPAKREEQKNGLTAYLEQHHASLVCMGEVGLDFSPWILQKAADVCKAAANGNDGVKSTGAAPLAADWKSQINEAEVAEQRVQQIAFFRYQVQLAIKYGLPLNIHSRSASTAVMDVLKEEGVGIGMKPATAPSSSSSPAPITDASPPPITVLLHAFNGSAKSLNEAVRRGYFFTATTSLVRDDQVQKLFHGVFKDSKRTDVSIPGFSGAFNIPIVLQHLVLESDSPALAPVKPAPPPPPAIAESVVDSSASTAASLTASTSTHSCGLGGNNEPANLYIGLQCVYSIYLDAERARAEEEAAKQAKQAAKASKQKSSDTAPSTTVASNNASTSSSIVTQTAAPTPLSIDQFAVLTFANTHRLFPRLRR